jgi:hypothetical protein
MSIDFTPNDIVLKTELTNKLIALEKHLDADVLSFTGAISEFFVPKVLGILEDLAKSPQKKDKIYIILKTPGGSAEAVERYVNILRHHYATVNFIVPDYAYSAGTIFCMSGDNILMDYYSVLGPIDPQVQNKEGRWVAALGYLDKLNELLLKAQNKTMSDAEFIVFKEFDLAEIRGYEQARDLTIDLMKRWLVKYKFKNWNAHETNKTLLGNPVTDIEKEERAADVAKLLGDTSRWKSHGRPINMEILRSEMRLKIEDFSLDTALNELIRSYSNFSNDYLKNLPQNQNFIHTRNFI